MIRAILWETDEIGAFAANTILRHPKIDLVGIYVGSNERAGRSVSDLVPFGAAAELAPRAILSTAIKDEIYSMPADCVVHCPPQELEPEQVIDDICELLRSGKNVVSTALMHLIHPSAMPDTTRSRIEEACETGGVSFHATGINPGYFSEVLPTLLTSACSDIKTVDITELHSYAGNPSKWIVSDFVCMGRPLEARRARDDAKRAIARMGRAPLSLLAEAMSLEFDEITCEVDLFAATERFEIAATTVEVGTLAAAWSCYTAKLKGEARIRLNFIHRAAPHVAPDWPQMSHVPTSWRVEIDAVPRVVNETVLSVEEGLPTYAGAGAHVANAVPAVCAAAPGIVTRLGLPLFGGAAL